MSSKYRKFFFLFWEILFISKNNTKIRNTERHYSFSFVNGYEMKPAVTHETLYVTEEFRKRKFKFMKKHTNSYLGMWISATG